MPDHLLAEVFTMPRDFSLEGMLGDAWGIWTSDHPVDLVLRFAPSVGRRVRETVWHRSQQLVDLPGGGVEMRLTVAAPIEVRPWILGWGSACEVVAPEAFRAELAAEAAAMAAQYVPVLPADASARVAVSIGASASRGARRRGPSPAGPA